MEKLIDIVTKQAHSLLEQVNVYCFLCGHSLSNLEQYIRAYWKELVKSNQLTSANYCRIHWQCILNLLGVSEQPTVLSGEVMQEEEFLSLSTPRSNRHYLYFLYLYYSSIHTCSTTN